MKKLLLLTVMMLAAAGLAQKAVASPPLDVIYLKDGNIVQGIITQMIPGESVTIRAGQSFLTYGFDDILRFDRQSSAVGIKPYRSPAAAWALSSLLPGLGQFYNGDIGPGIGMLVCFGGGITMMTIGISGTGSIGLMAIGGLLATCTYLASMIHAPIRANRLNLMNGWLSFEVGRRGSFGMSPALVLAGHGTGGGRLHPGPGVNLSLRF